MHGLGWFDGFDGAGVLAEVEGPARQPSAHCLTRSHSPRREPPVPVRRPAASSMSPRVHVTRLGAAEPCLRHWSLAGCLWSEWVVSSATVTLGDQPRQRGDRSAIFVSRVTGKGRSGLRSHGRLRGRAVHLGEQTTMELTPPTAVRTVAMIGASALVATLAVAVTPAEQADAARPCRIDTSTSLDSSQRFAGGGILRRYTRPRRAQPRGATTRPRRSS